MLKGKRTEIERLKAMQKSQINDDYSCGIYNGLELASAVLDGREPAFLSVVKEPVVKRVDEEEKPVKRTIASGKRRVGYADVVVSSKGTKNTNR